MGIIRALADTLKALAEARKAIADRLSAEEVIRKKTITMAADLDMGFLQKILNALREDTVLTITLKSGEVLKMWRERPAGAPTAQADERW